ncbi:hypothetical protein [Pyxidicoccus xibeiensis]|uniref:hypothetical protein n=1 Tax=Pyxidicoccus xibeiensis TaxID=2906759 RepID=UPI0020A81944|nr:hypothetical protein [Pyxidicoccus xibeiensis]MCP3139575.1 hypothetical protein [Pyxidicoccus xibeiensis]
MLLLCLGPARAAAELPWLTLPASGLRGLQLDLHVGNQADGVGVYVPIRPYNEVDGLALEVRQGNQNKNHGLDLAYHRQLTPARSGSSCNWCEDLFYWPKDFNVGAQVGFHLRTAAPYTNQAGLGPALGLSMARRATLFGRDTGFIEGFAGVQGAAVFSPSSSRLEVPLRASLGVQAKLCVFHLMLATRAGWDDMRQGLNSRTSAEVTFSIGFWDCR